MSALGATVAIVRRSVDRRFGLRLAAGLALGGAIGAYGSLRVARATLVLALVRGPLAGRDRRLDLIGRVSLYAMPLYGRQLARALAIAPTLQSLAVPAGIALGARARGRSVPRDLAIAVGCATSAATLVAISARLRSGREAALYVALAVITEGVVLTPAAVRLPRAGRTALALTGVIGFVALRGFGEALARYDPLPRDDAGRSGPLGP